jgi:hypothetical protein
VFQPCVYERDEDNPDRLFWLDIYLPKRKFRRLLAMDPARLAWIVRELLSWLAR